MGLMVSEKIVFKFFPLEVYVWYMLPWQPEFQSDLPENLMQPSHYPLPTPPDNASHEIRSRLAIWYQKYTYLKVWTDDGGY